MTCHSLRLKFWLDIFKWIKILHFPGDLAFQIAGVEKCDSANAATALEKRIPECFQSDPIRGENPHPGDDDAVLLNHSAHQPTKNLIRPKVGLDESRKSLALKANEALACIKEPNSNVPTKCSHYIFHPLCPAALIHNFSVIHKIDLARRLFLFNPPPSPQLFQPAIIHIEYGTPLALNPPTVHISAAPDPAKVLIIDDEIGPRESLRMLLKPSYQVHTAENVETGLQLLQEKRPDTIVMDIRMPGMNGIDGLRRIREIDPHLSVIMFTGFGALETAQEALRLGANDYINKPFDAVQMREVIGRNVERTRLQRQSEATAHELQELNERLRNELAQKERLASLGQASAEFVHDLSNPLTIVWGYVQILAKKLEQSGDGNNGERNASSSRELHIIEQNVRLCRELLTMWQSYGRVGAIKPKPISMSSIVQDVGQSVTGMASQNGVQLDCHIAEEELTVLGDPTQLTRALQNVIVNAIQAATEKHGKVVVNCREKDLYADIQVRDTGYGIAEDEIGKIFEPYFTTKQGKNGTGLGLYITKKVIDDHKGSIDVASTLGVGTTFTLRLPLHDK